MSPALKQRLLRFFATISEMHKAEARCTCGRQYRLVFKTDLREEIDMIESMIAVEPEPGRGYFLEVDSK